MTKPSEIRPVGRSPRPAPSQMEDYYLRVLRHWYRFKRSAPSLSDLADLCRRSGRPGNAGHQELVSDDWPSKRAVRRGLLALEEKGYARRNGKGRFEVIR